MSGYHVAVVIPLFDKAPLIHATLQSVLAQTLPPAEVIIVDDGSSDGSIDVIADLIGGPVRLVRQDNAGPGPARNRGTAEAHSEWIALIDGDDLWAPDHLATLAGVAHASRKPMWSRRTLPKGCRRTGQWPWPGPATARHRG